MNAILSAERGVALLLDQDELVAMVTTDSRTDRRAPMEFVATWLRGIEDPLFVEDTDAESVQRKLRAAVDAERAFRLFLPLFDLSMPAGVLDSVGEEIERLFVQHPLLKHTTAARFYGDPFPSIERLDSAFSLAADRPWPLLYKLLSDLRERQSLIRSVCMAWAELSPDKFLHTLPAKEIHELFVRLGLFYRLVDNMASHASLASFIDVEGESRRLAHVPHRYYILRQWLDALFREEALEEEQRAYQVALAETRAEVEERKVSILDRVRQGDLVAAESEARDLITFQLARGAKKYPAMSLCDLAIRAKERGACRAQELFARLATETNPEDPQCWTQFADAQKERGATLEALATYERLIGEHPEHAVAKRGRAEVLRDLNRLPAALAAYDAIIELDSEDVIAKCGRAEVLRDLNRLPEALAAYDVTIATDPENVFAKTGRAEVLRDLNRLPEALAAYDATVAMDPESAVAKRGRAEVLRDLNRLPAALAAYDAIIELDSEDVIAKCGRAEVLRDLNRLPEALATYDAIVATHPENVIAKTGRANVLCKLGRDSEALERLPTESVESLAEWSGFHLRGMIYLRQRRWTEAKRVFRLGCEAGLPLRQDAFFRAGMVLCQMRLGEIGEALNNLEAVTSRRLTRARSAIRAHALGASGAIIECQAELARARSFPQLAIHRVADEVEARFIFHNSNRDDDFLLDAEVDLLLAA